MYKFNMFNGSLEVGQCTYCVFDLSLFSKIMCLYGNMFPNCSFSSKVLLNFTFSTYTATSINPIFKMLKNKLHQMSTILLTEKHNLFNGDLHFHKT